MTLTDANGSTWLHLGTEHDFLPGDPPLGPALGVGVTYDSDRHVLELLADRSRRRRRPPPGVAVDPAGDVYLVAGRDLLVERCDGSRVPLVCEPGVVREPQGLALDRRGRLYVADRARRRVVVLNPDDGLVEARLEAPGLREPVDVLVAPAGDVFVADRGGGDVLGLEPGRIWRFDARFGLVGSWIPRDGATPPRPVRPRPIAILLDGADVVVADDMHPRLLAFAFDGSPRPERDYAVLGATTRARFGTGPPSATFYDAGASLAQVHAALRLLRLTAGGRYRGEGEWLSAVLDGGVPGTTWHRIDLQGELPAGTSVAVASASAETRDTLASPAAWDELRDRDGAVLRFSGTPVGDAPALGYSAPATAARVREQLVQSRPGRFLRLRVQLRGDGSATPSVRALKVTLPRNSYRNLLPAVWSEEPVPRDFLDGFLALFERMFTRIEGARDDFYRRLCPAAAPPDVLAWLAGLLDLSFDPSWPLPRRRALVAEATELYRRRGTPAGLARYVEVYAGVRPIITEAFRERPGHAPTAGGSVLGQSFAIGLAAPGEPPEQALMRAFAHRFTVHLQLPDECERDRVLAVVDRIVTINKPAHTFYTLEVLTADARVGINSTVGVDLIPGARPVPGTRLTGGPGSPVLGADTVLGARRPNTQPPDPSI